MVVAVGHALLSCAAGTELAPAGPGSVQRLDAGCTELIVDLAFADARRGIAVGGDREQGTSALLLRTADGGRSWQRVDLGLETRLYGVHFATPQVAFVVGLAGTLLRTTDGGVRWERLDAGLEGWLAAVRFVSGRAGFVAAGDTILATSDGGRRWRPVPVLGCGGGAPTALRDLAFVGSEVGYAVGRGGLILRTRDGGRSWQRVPSGVDAWLRAICFVDPTTGFVAGTGVLLATSDGGSSWRLLPHPREKLNDVLFLSPERGYTVTMEGHLWRTVDGGTSWQLAHDNRSLALTSLARPAPGACIAAGDGGTLLAFPP